MPLQNTRAEINVKRLKARFAQADGAVPGDPSVDPLRVLQKNLQNKFGANNTLPSPILPEDALRAFHEPMNKDAGKRMILMDQAAAERIYRAGSVHRRADVVVLVNGMEDAEKRAYEMMDSQQGRKNKGLHQIIYARSQYAKFWTPLTRETLTPRAHEQILTLF